MNPCTRDEQQAARPPKSRRRVLLWLGSVLCIGLLAVLAASHLRTPAAPAIKWLTAAERTRMTRDGPITQLKWKLLRIVGPLARVFHRSKTQIRLEVKLISLAPEAAGQIPL